MNTPTRLSLYGLGLVAAFGAAFAVSAAIVPAKLTQARTAAVEEGAHGGEHGGEEAAPAASAALLPGLSLSQDGFALQPIEAPHSTGESGTLEFSILDEEGKALTKYETEHEKDLHLIVVRSDGSLFRHVHPTMDNHGTWSIPWEWNEGGSYRVFADFVPHGSEDGITLSRTVQVDGAIKAPHFSDEERVAEVDGFTATLDGELSAGSESTLTVSIEKDGKPVTAIEPYLGAFGHLVALRDGDLAYLHVHPTGDEPKAGQVSGPDVSFATEAPTAGRYLLYFDFQVAGETHSAAFVLTAGQGDGSTQAAHEDEEAH